VSDWPEKIFEHWLSFERELGSIEDWELARKYVDSTHWCNLELILCASSDDAMPRQFRLASTAKENKRDTTHNWQHRHSQLQHHVLTEGKSGPRRPKLHEKTRSPRIRNPPRNHLRARNEVERIHIRKPARKRKLQRVPLKRGKVSAPIPLPSLISQVVEEAATTEEEKDTDAAEKKPEEKSVAQAEEPPAPMVTTDGSDPKERTVFVGNLPFSIDESKLRSIFSSEVQPYLVCPVLI